VEMEGVKETMGVVNAELDKTRAELAKSREELAQVSSDKAIVENELIEIKERLEHSREADQGIDAARKVISNPWIFCNGPFALNLLGNETNRVLGLLYFSSCRDSRAAHAPSAPNPKP
jgi:hypothetical protein